MLESLGWLYLRGVLVVKVNQETKDDAAYQEATEDIAGPVGTKVHSGDAHEDDQ